jgi:hypothetical protein
MFRFEQFAKVNANPVGGHAPGCLLVTGGATALSDPYGFNNVQGCDGNFYRAVNARTGEGIYGVVEVSAADLEGITVTPFERPAPPPALSFANPPREFTFPGDEFGAAPDGTLRVTRETTYRAVPLPPGEPHVVTS